MTAVLFGITLVASAGVGVVNMITIEPIAAAKAAATTAALSEVLPPFDETATEQMTIDELPITVYTATKDGEVSGYAVESMTKQGFNGVVRLMVGFTPDGTIYNVNVLEQAETPGLGTKMADEGNPLLGSVKGQNPAEKKLVDGRLAVTKDGGDVDVLTAATISSRAWVDAINRAWSAYRSAVSGEAPADAASGASKSEWRRRVLEGGRGGGRRAPQTLPPQRIRIQLQRAPMRRKEVKMNKLQIILSGIVKNNPTFVLVLGMCPTLGTTTSAANGMGMGLATTAVLIMSNLVISLIKNIIPDKVRIPAFIVVIASFVTIIQMLMQAFVPALYAALGVFIPLIVVNCIILGRAEAFASKNSPVDSIMDGIGIGIGFTLSLTVIGAVREVLGSGALFGMPLGISDYTPLVFVLAPGGFLTLGYLMVLFNKLAKK
ncbi:electron transport complex RnfABCDGE type E subunit [Alistipes sp. CAG:268]|nr:electron transport complex RnfABCDGE type E subunit [Alistipes sp. CAG:268]